MRILFCTTMFEHAMTGAGRFAQCIATMPAHIPEVEVHVLSEDISAGMNGQGSQVQLSRASRSRYFGYFFKSRDYAKTVHQSLQREPADILFFNDAWLAYHWLRSGNSIPVVTFQHDYNAIRIWQHRLTAMPVLLLRRWMERTALRRANLVLTNSGYMCKSMAIGYGLAVGQLHAIPLAFVDYDRITCPIQPIDRNDPIRVLFMKNDIRCGGLAILLEALSKLEEYRFEISIVGPAWSRTKEKVINRYKKAPHIKIQLHGSVFHHADVFDLMARHHFYCVPSEREAFGIGNLEALASGLRVIFYPVGGIPEELAKYGWPLKERTTAAIRSVFRDILEGDNMLQEQKIREGQRWLAHAYSPEGMYAALYRALGSVRATKSSIVNP